MTLWNSDGRVWLHHRSYGYHDTPGQTQRKIGAHVYVFQRNSSDITVWRSEMAAGDYGYRWTRVHSLKAMGGAR
jgi:hypothetical protein